jgi:deoxyribodipyrimidine photo-lyase
MKMTKVGVYIFRRDLRLEDNHGLLELLRQCTTVIPVFLLDQQQITKHSKNQYYFSSNAVQFMCESLVDLDKQLRQHKSRLRLFYGHPWEHLDKLLATLKKTRLQGDTITVGWNHDYSEYSQARDEQLKDVCERHGVDTLVGETDYTLRPISEYVKKDGGGFKQYGAFYKSASQKPPTKPETNIYTNYWKGSGARVASFDGEYAVGSLSNFYQPNPRIAQHGGRTEALAKLNALTADGFKHYDEKRDLLNYSTTNLSAALNFGCISVREAYYAIQSALGKNTVMLKQLYWRDFYLQAVHALPHAASYTRHMDERYDRIPWKNDKKDWERLWNAQTGFLLVDAAMEEMKTSGFMHNRARMIVAVFWTKYLLINIYHPQFGSQVGYSRLLVDAVGPSQNKLNHAWVDEFDFPGKKYAASGAPLSGRPMDISNKMIKKWDGECSYIKKWLPHLKDIPNKELYTWNEKLSKHYDGVHPAPMFDPSVKYKEWIEACRNLTSI